MGDEKLKNEAMEILGLCQVLPRLVVFDLDYTLWPFYWYMNIYNLAFVIRQISISLFDCKFSSIAFCFDE